MSWEHALIPMRAQPLHYGHINLLVTVSQHYRRCTVLLSPGTDSENDPYSFDLREKRLTQAFSLYWCHYAIQPLPRFPSPSHSQKTSKDISLMQKRFATIWWRNFIIVSGNPHVIDLCATVYHFPFLFLTQDKPLDWMLPVDNPFTKLEANWSYIRSLLHTRQFDIISRFVPPYVLDDMQSQLLQNDNC